MSLASSLNEAQIRLNRVEYAIQAMEYAHGGAECPDEDYCDMCRQKVFRVVDRLEELPRFIRVLLWVFTPISSWRYRQVKQSLKAYRVAEEPS